MMRDWLDSYRALLEEGRSVAPDLVGRSAELAEENRDEDGYEFGGSNKRGR
jgi:hypothetical protein